jgi:hypothetical protein
MEQWLEVVPPVLVYVIVGVVIGLESVGVPCPGEIVLVTAALMASQHDNLSPVWSARAPRPEQSPVTAWDISSGTNTGAACSRGPANGSRTTSSRTDHPSQGPVQPP